MIQGTELKPSALCLGGGVLCDLTREKELFRLMDVFFEQGGNFIDTANIYGKWLEGARSTSEIMLGNWMKSRKNNQHMVVTTKGGHPGLSTMEVQRLSKEELTADLNDSLHSMQVERIDLYWLHRDDEQRAAGEIIESLNDSIREGKIRYIGTSNWSAARIREANAYAQRHGLQGFVANQPMWSLAHADMTLVGDQTLRAMDADMLALHRETGMAAIPFSSQAGGYFQKLADGKAIDDHLKAYHLAENINRLPVLQRLAQERGKSVNQVALAYLMNQPFTTIPIVGCGRIEQLQESLGALDIGLTAEQLKELENTKRI